MSRVQHPRGSMPGAHLPSAQARFAREHLFTGPYLLSSDLLDQAYLQQAGVPRRRVPYLCRRQCRSWDLTPPPQVLVHAVHLVHSPHQYAVTSAPSSRLLEVCARSCLKHQPGWGEQRRWHPRCGACAGRPRASPIPPAPSKQGISFSI